MTTKQLPEDTAPAYLIEYAESLIDSDNLPEALKQYNHILTETSQNSFLYQRRGWVKRFTNDFQGGIRDFDRAIELSPDDATLYIQRAACRSHGLSNMENVKEDIQNKGLHKVIEDYRNSLKRNPSYQIPWLATIETHLLLHDWDDAIAVYGVCQPYITSDRFQVIRAWLGCLSMCMCGDPINSEDEAPLLNDTIRLYRMDWCVAEIDFLLNDLTKQTPDRDGLDAALRLHQVFLSHYDEEPFR